MIHIHTPTPPPTQAHRELSHKLEEVNRHLEQQSQAQDTLVRLRLSSENDQRDKLDR